MDVVPAPIRLCVKRTGGRAKATGAKSQGAGCHAVSVAGVVLLVTGVARRVGKRRLRRWGSRQASAIAAVAPACSDLSRPAFARARRPGRCRPAGAAGHGTTTRRSRAATSARRQRPALGSDHPAAGGTIHRAADQRRLRRRQPARRRRAASAPPRLAHRNRVGGLIRRSSARRQRRARPCGIPGRIVIACQIQETALATGQRDGRRAVRGLTVTESGIGALSRGHRNARDR